MYRACRVVLSFATFSPGLPNNVPSTAKVLPCIAGKSAQKVGTILPLSYQPLSMEAFNQAEPVQFPGHAYVYVGLRCVPFQPFTEA